MWAQYAETAVYQKVREPDMKYKIERNTVQETLILPLYSRKLCSELYPNLYRDETAVRLIDQIDYDFSVAEKNSRSLMQRFGALEVAMRQCDLAWEVRDYLKTHPCAAVVNLGCGLDNTGRACDNGRCGAAGENEPQTACCAAAHSTHAKSCLCLRNIRHLPCFQIHLRASASPRLSRGA